MKTYNIKFEMPYIEVDNFKQKNLNVLVNTIGGSRLRDHMSYDGCASITFGEDDKQHFNPIVTMQDKFNRLKTNCIVYSLPKTVGNDDYYDKLFIYYSAGVKISYYGYVLFNTKTNKCAHTYFLEYDDNVLLRCLNQVFNTLYMKELHRYFSKKNDAVKRRYGLTLKDCPTISDYNIIKKSYEDRIKKAS